MRVVVAGSSGFLGTHLVRELAARGHDVARLVRGNVTGEDEYRWDPASRTIDAQALDGADVVVNLAGSPTAGNPHSKKWARELRESRVSTTEILAEAIARAARPPAFLAGNGISFYGDHGGTPVTETSDSRGDALLTAVAREWEAATGPAVEAGARVCVLRTSPVMDRRSQPLKTLAQLFRLGLGARLGNGRQYFPMISLRDWVGGVCQLAESADAGGPFNLCCPATPTNAEFTAALAAAVHRKAFVAVPAPLLSVGAGRMAPELLGSVNARPQALLATGYTFSDRDVTDVLATGLRAD